MVKDADAISPEEQGSSKKGQGLLKVPSRSSSHKNQSSPTSTGLSGATASESRNSISGQSRDSKRSFLGRQRNGSASSKRTGGDTEQTNTPGNTSPNSPTQKRKKKSGGLLSLLGCCGSPDDGNAADGETQNAHKLDTLPQRPATSKSRTNTPQDQAGTKASKEKEKEKESDTVQQREDRGAVDDEDRISPVDGDARRTSVPPAVTIEPPKSSDQTGVAGQATKTTDGEDVTMHDVPAEESRTAIAAVTTEEDKAAPVPVVPSPPTQVVPTEAGPSGAEPQIALLGPIAPEHKGRKCLVLDLDETLVHSSFKVSGFTGK